MRKKNSAVLFRVDAGSRWGNGHLMRCLALGHSLKQTGADVGFLSKIEPPGLGARVRNAGMSVVDLKRRRLGGEPDAKDAISNAEKIRASWVVIDGPYFSHEYQDMLQKAGLRVLVIDDHGTGPFSADLILNQNLHAVADLYAGTGSTRLLLGPSNALLRSEFHRWVGWKKPISPLGTKILLTMGGSDPEDSASFALQSLDSIAKRLDVVIAVGSHYRYGRKLARLAASSPHRVRIIRETDRMARLMAWADLAISTFGTTSWEMAFMGLPAVSLVVEDHQMPFAHALEKTGAVVRMGRYTPSASKFLCESVGRLTASREQRTRMSRIGRRLVDGLGNQRVIKAMGMAKKLT